jgi:PAS domain S-box-containing protein
MERLEQFANLINGWLWETDREHKFVYLSASVELYTDVSPEWHYGKSRMDMRGDDITDSDWERHIDTLESHEPFENFRFRRMARGKTRWLTTSGEPIFNDKGNFEGYRGVAKDITNEVALSMEAQKGTPDLINALGIIDEGLVYFDADDRLVMCNEKFRQYYSKSRDILVWGTRFEDIIRHGLRNGQIDVDEDQREQWIKDRLAIHNSGNSITEQQLSNGRWLRITERRTPDGGIIGMRADITKLKEAQRKAEEADRAKSEFLATMSHELRTPLTSIKGSLGVMSMMTPESLQESGMEMLNVAMRNSDAMLLLVNELLDYEKILSGALVIESSPHDICALTRKVVEDNRGFAEAHAVKFNLQSLDEPAIAEIQEHRFEQVVRNLLSNAAKFSEPGDMVDIEVTKNGGLVSVRVKDNGPGISDEFKEHIFAPFTQADSSSTRKKPGSGLGLAISKALTEGMGGSLEFETQIGVGSCFYVRFPQFGVQS